MNAKFNASAPATKSRSATSVARWPPRALKARPAQLARQSPRAVTSPRAPRHRRPEHSSWSPSPTRHDGTALRRPTKSAVFGPSVAKRVVQLASERSGGKNAAMQAMQAMQASPSAFTVFSSPRPSRHGVLAGHSWRGRVVANPSLKLSANSVARRPSSAGPSAHFALAVQHATLLAPA